MNKDKTKYRINLSVSDIADGGFNEKLQMEFEKVFANIHDMNTKFKDKRIITAKFTFEPDEDREIIKLSMDFVTSLAPIEGLSVKVVTGKDLKTNTIAAHEFMSTQRGQTYFDDDGIVRDDIGQPVDVIEQEMENKNKILELKKGNE